MTNVRATGLPMDWAYSPTIDLELKQYMLMGYVQRVKSRFSERKLYPYLADVRSRTDDLTELQRTKRAFVRTLSRPLIGLDPNTGALLRAPIPEHEPLRVIDEVIEFAVPSLRQLLDQGLQLQEELLRQVSFTPIGVLPLYVSEGWLFLRRGREARLYAYAVPAVTDQQPELPHRVAGQYALTAAWLSSTCEARSSAVRLRSALPSPSVSIPTAWPPCRRCRLARASRHWRLSSTLAFGASAGVPRSSMSRDLWVCGGGVSV